MLRLSCDGWGPLVMTQTNLTRWIEAAEARRVCDVVMFEQAMPQPSGMRACLRSAVATVQSRVHAFAADRRTVEVCDSAQKAERQIVHFRSVLLD